MESIVNSLVIGVIALACLYTMYKCKDNITEDYEDIIHDLQQTNSTQLDLINKLNSENKELYNSNQELRKQLLDYLMSIKELTMSKHNEHTNIS